MAKLGVFVIPLAVALGLFTGCAAQNSRADLPPYDVWLQQTESDAITAGISPATVHAALDNSEPNQRVIYLDQKQPEHTTTFDTYVKHTLTPDRIRIGRNMMHEYADVLDEISRRYGVPPQVIVALWGVESSFGRDSGDFSVVNSLATLAYEGRRAELFKKELIESLKIIDQTHIRPDQLRGSWAGAMGQCQFMPSTYLSHSASYTGQGAADIWHNTRDVFASIANYLQSEGWRADLTWGREVDTGDEVTSTDIGLNTQKSLQEWANLGVRNVDGSALPNKPLMASMVQPDGADGRSFLVYDNYRVIMRWNRSTYFATTIGLFADRIR